MLSPQSLDEYYMAQCLSLAEKGRTSVSPNPMVGAVVLNASGKKISEGYHLRPGEPHAEVIALDRAGEASRGGTLYINLEPCNHTGRTPPCTERILASGVRRVVCGTPDPNPWVQGKGVEALKAKGVAVTIGVLESVCCEFNEIFFHWIQAQRPFITLKLAMTLDGKIADRQGHSRWITGDFSRQYVHLLRNHHDSILTTAQTVMADDPQLIPRFWTTAGNNRLSPPVRIVLDRTFRLVPKQFRIFNTADAPTWVFTSKVQHNQSHAEEARALGVQVFEVDDTGIGLSLEEVFRTLGEKSLTSVWVEAGGHLAGHLLEGSWIDKCYFFYGGKLLPDPSAIQGLSGLTHLNLSQAPAFKIRRHKILENDFMIEAYPIKTSKSEEHFNSSSYDLQPTH